jgi:hypothetical protein
MVFDPKQNIVVTRKVISGLGFGGMPLHLVEADLASRTLVEIAPEGAPSRGHMITMSAIYGTDGPPSPAGRWFIERLKQQDARSLQEKAPVSVAAAAKRQQSHSGSLAKIRSLPSNEAHEVNI